MGSYSNPEQVKDYSNEIVNAWSRAAENVTSGFIKYGEEKQAGYAARIKEYNNNKVEVKKLQQNIYTNIDKMAEGYGGADFRKTFDNVVQRYGEINLRLKNGTSENEAQDMSDLSRFEGIISLTKSGIESQMSYKPTYDTAFENGANPGGFDAIQAMDNNGNNVLNHMSAVYGKRPGEKSIEILYDDREIPIDVLFKSNSLKGEPEWKGQLSATALQQSDKFGIDIIPIVPDSNKIIGESLATSGFVKKINVVDPATGVSKPKITGPADKYYINSAFKPSGSKVQGKVEEEFVSEFDSKTYIQDLLNDKTFQATVDGILANPGRAAALMNSTGYRTTANTEQWKGTNFVNPSPVTKDLFKKSVAEYYAKNQAPKRVETSELGEKITKIRETTAKEDVDFSVETDTAVKGKWGPKETERVILAKNKKSKITYYPPSTKKQPKIESLP